MRFPWCHAFLCGKRMSNHRSTSTWEAASQSFTQLLDSAGFRARLSNFLSLFQTKRFWVHKTFNSKARLAPDKVNSWSLSRSIYATIMEITDWQFLKKGKLFFTVLEARKSKMKALPGTIVWLGMFYISTMTRCCCILQRRGTSRPHKAEGTDKGQIPSLKPWHAKSSPKGHTVRWGAKFQHEIWTARHYSNHSSHLTKGKTSKHFLNEQMSMWISPAQQRSPLCDTSGFCAEREREREMHEERKEESSPFLPVMMMSLT